MAEIRNDVESVRLTVGADEYTLEKGGQISVEAIGNDIIFHRAGKMFMRLAYTLFTTPVFTSAVDGRSQIEAFLAGGSSTATYAEDAAHASGDTGTFVLAVRNDPNAAGVPGVLAGTSGDYIPIATDDRGAIWVRQYPPVANLSDFVAITRAANTTAYAINDVMNGGTDTTPFVFTLARANDVRGWIVGGLCVSGSNQATLPNIDLMLFSSTFTIAGDNAAFAPTYAQMQTYLGKIRFSTWVARGVRSDSDGAVEQPFIFITGSGTSDIYGVAVMQNAYTPVSSETLQFTVFAEQY